MDLAAFVLSALPPPPARVLEVGCGAGELARGVDAAGYRVLAIDPEAPEGRIFRRTRLEELDDAGPFDAAVATYALHHIEPLVPAVGRIATLLETDGRLVLEEFGWDLVDEATAAWYGQQQGGRSAESVLADWCAEHGGCTGTASCGARSTSVLPSAPSSGGPISTGRSTATTSRPASGRRSLEGRFARSVSATSASAANSRLTRSRGAASGVARRRAP